MAYKEKDTKKWTAQWFETTAKGEKKKRRKREYARNKTENQYFLAVIFGPSDGTPLKTDMIL